MNISPSAAAKAGAEEGLAFGLILLIAGPFPATPLGKGSLGLEPLGQASIRSLGVTGTVSSARRSGRRAGVGDRRPVSA
jgi:hypothetical protein